MSGNKKLIRLIDSTKYTDTLYYVHRFPFEQTTQGKEGWKKQSRIIDFLRPNNGTPQFLPLHARRDRENKQKVDEATTRRIRVLLVERTGKTQRGKGALLLTQRKKEAKLASGAKPEESQRNGRVSWKRFYPGKGGKRGVKFVGRNFRRVDSFNILSNVL